MPDRGRTTAGMVNRVSQKPAECERAGLKLVQKTQELMQRTGGHALAMFADSKHQCRFFATEALQSVATDPEAIQLVQNLHPNQFVTPRCIAAVCTTQIRQPDCQYQHSGARWYPRAGTLEWCSRKLSADPATYITSLSGGAWAVPDINVHGRKLSVQRTDQVHDAVAILSRC